MKLLFDFILNLFKKKSKTVGWTIPSPEELKAVNVARGITGPQILLAQGTTEEPGKISNPEHITPWVVGYLNGVLDCAVQNMAGKEHSSLELLTYYLECSVVRGLHTDIMACYSGSTSFHNKPEHPFYKMYEEFVLGAKEGYEYFDNYQSGNKSLALFNRLKNKK